MITIEDVKLMFVSYVQGAAYAFAKMSDRGINPMTHEGTNLMQFVVDTVLKALVKGLLAYKEDSHKIVYSEKISEVGHIFDVMMDMLQTAYAEKMATFHPSDRAPEALNICLGYALKKHEADVLVMLSQANKILSK